MNTAWITADWIAEAEAIITPVPQFDLLDAQTAAASVINNIVLLRLAEVTPVTDAGRALIRQRIVEALERLTEWVDKQ